jgi:Domain of unknown function (DUF4160)
MPLITQLHGAITIHIYYGDHLPPHFHAKGRGWVIRINIATVSVMTVSGFPPAETERELLNFATRRQTELALCWTLCQGGMKPGKVSP